MGYDLYNGSVGLSLFLAALDRAASTTTHGALTVAALRPLRQTLGDKRARTDLADSIGIGGMTGMGSLLQPLILLHRWLDDGGLLAMARQTAEAITPVRIEADSLYNIKSGSAGALLGLLALYRVDPADIWLDRARLCSRHLVRHCLTNASPDGAGVPAETGYRRLGYVGGHTGIACALLRGYAVIGEQEVLDAALGTLDAGRRALNDINEDRADRGAVRHVPGGADWCCGRLGIALAQIHCLRLGRTGTSNVSTCAQKEITAALDTIGRAEISPVDRVCCGNFGRVDGLLEASRLLGQHRYHQSAGSVAAHTLARADINGAFALFEGNQGKDFIHPGFYRGLSGIGYALLRLAQPKLPCVWSGGG